MNEHQARNRFRRLAQLGAAVLLVVSLFPSAGASAQSDPVPLAEALATLQPRSVWQHFYALTQVPRRPL